jgi:hypothetical protein
VQGLDFMAHPLYILTYKSTDILQNEDIGCFGYVINFMIYYVVLVPIVLCTIMQADDIFLGFGFILYI